jgi:predicted enzyme related to lactoylglutathione lyase
MGIDASYVHTNLIARDWETLAGFYQRVFGCIPVPPVRDLRGAELDAGTGIAGAHVRGAHLRLPGHGENGPTLEIFTYSVLASGCQSAVNRPGFGHIAFSVRDVAHARSEVLQAGGGVVGDIVTLRLPTGAAVTWCYASDPEGNIIELQAWSN